MGTYKVNYLSIIYILAITVDNMTSKQLSDALKVYYKGDSYNYSMIMNDIRRECGIILLSVQSGRIDNLRDCNLLRMCEICDLKPIS